MRSRNNEATILCVLARLGNGIITNRQKRNSSDSITHFFVSDSPGRLLKLSSVDAVKMAPLVRVAGSILVRDRLLTAVIAGASSLSFVGSGFIVLCYVLFKELRKFSYKLVFYLALSVRIFFFSTLYYCFLIIISDLLICLFILSARINGFYSNFLISTTDLED